MKSPLSWRGEESAECIKKSANAPCWLPEFRMVTARAQAYLSADAIGQYTAYSRMLVD